MKKFGFTLAEVLVTMGIVGVISALTIPTLVSNTTEAQIGPKLAKAVSTFEQANEAFLNARASDSLTDSGIITNNGTGNYSAALSAFLKLTIEHPLRFVTKDNMRFTVQPIWPLNFDSSLPAYQQRIGVVSIDIDASNDGRTGTDTFVFSWWNDGSLRPMGGTNWDGSGVSSGPGHWTTDCPVGAVPTTPASCAGHIFENNLRVLYK